MTDLGNILTPTLLLDRKKVMGNIEAMMTKAEESNVRFRPHCKTHQSLEIGRWLKDYEVSCITVSSVQMAQYFSGQWDDITIAFPVNIREIQSIDRLSESVKLNVLVESLESIDALQKGLSHAVGAYIKVDVGTHRTGIEVPVQMDLLDSIMEAFRKNSRLAFKGFLSHAGHTYQARSLQEIDSIHLENIRIMTGLKKRYLSDFPNLELSTGDTPSCSLLSNFESFDEVRPGNFIFYDLSQWQIGSCTIEEIAAVLACPVVAKHRSRHEIVVYGGGIHLSKDRLMLGDKLIYGLPAVWNGTTWTRMSEDSHVRSLSQEHGVIRVSDSEFDQIQIGDLIMIMPVHICMTADLMKSYLSTDGHQITMMRINQ